MPLEYVKVLSSSASAWQFDGYGVLSSDNWVIFTYRANNHSTTAWKLCLFFSLMIYFKKLFTLLTGPNGLCVGFFFYCTEYFQMQFNVKMHHVLKSLSEKQFVQLHMCRLSSLQIAFQDGRVTQYSQRLDLSQSTPMLLWPETQDLLLILLNLSLPYW